MEKSNKNKLKWVILNKTKNSFGDLIVTFVNIKTAKTLETTFSEGEHHQLDLFLESLNNDGGNL